MIKTYYENPDWWCVMIKTSFGEWAVTVNPSWTADEYELRESVKHPDNQKPKLKLVDMSKLPKGTMTNHGELLGHHVDGFATMITRNLGLCSQAHENLRIAEQVEFTYWGGGECPVPDGLMVEFKHRDGGASRAMAKLFRWNHLDEEGDVIAYRITGVADGWSDRLDEQ